MIECNNPEVDKIKVHAKYSLIFPANSSVKRVRASESLPIMWYIWECKIVHQAFVILKMQFAYL